MPTSNAPFDFSDARLPRRRASGSGWPLFLAVLAAIIALTAVIGLLLIARNRANVKSVTTPTELTKTVAARVRTLPTGKPLFLTEPSAPPAATWADVLREANRLSDDLQARELERIKNRIKVMPEGKAIVAVSTLSRWDEYIALATANGTAGLIASGFRFTGDGWTGDLVTPLARAAGRRMASVNDSYRRRFDVLAGRKPPPATDEIAGELVEVWRLCGTIGEYNARHFLDALLAHAKGERPTYLHGRAYEAYMAFVAD